MLMNKSEPNLERISRDIKTISTFTSPGEAGHTRISFSDEDRQARKHVARLMAKEAKLSVRVDPVGNLIGRREGKKQGAAILVGSHLDTVRGGGRFDGIAGVIAGIEVARRFEEKGIATIHPLEVVVFMAEEPSPFGISTVGSRGMAGKLQGEVIPSLEDDTGRQLETAIRQMDGNPERIDEARRSSGDVFAFFELHIEQGPFLASRGIPIGVVEGIVGISRGRIEVTGRNDHSGTTPMKARRDALAAASEIVLSLERVCEELDGVVGTIGKMDVFPNTTNVVPGRVTLGMEIRSHSEVLLDQTASLFKRELKRISERRRVQIGSEIEISSKPVVFNPKIVERIEGICDRLAIPHMKMISGAGHDASHIAEIAPTGMIFVPSRDGRSHCSEEWSEFEHICLGTEVLACTIIEIDREEDI
jgi:N-carbamoyl-L-amino-acid hydrolase